MSKAEAHRKIRLLLVDDHPMVLEGVKRHLSLQSDFEVAGEAHRADQAVRLARQLAPEIILLDVSMPDRSGLEVMPLLRRQVPGAKIVVLTMHDRVEYISRAIALGGRGYVLKDCSPAELVRAIRWVHAGQVYLSPSIPRLMLQGQVPSARLPSASGRLENLSQRERQVLILIAEGCSNKGMASQLHVSVRTVETHRERIMRKLNIHSVAGLTRFAIAQGLVRIE